MPINRLKSANWQSLPFHPLMVVTFQILVLYAITVNTASISAVGLVFLMVIFLTAVLFLLFSFLMKDIKRAAIATTLCCFSFFTYGRLFNVLEGFQLSGMLVGRPIYVFPLYLLIAIGGTIWVVRSRWCKIHLEEITYFFNMFSCILVMVAAGAAITRFDWVAYGSSRHGESKAFVFKKEAHEPLHNKSSILQPNVYYLVFDMYTSHRILEKYYHWDDSGVAEALRSRGLSVNKNACSNYPFTDLSLVATLNMRYIHEDRGFVDDSGKSVSSSRRREQNEVMERFRYEGYHVVSNMGGNRLPNNKHSKLNAKKSLLSDDFIALFVNVSILHIIKNELITDRMRQDILSELEDLKLFDIPNRPTFIFSHVLCPHPPYIFNADGSKPKLFESAWGRFDIKKSYVEQVKFIGTQIVEIVDSLRRRDPNAIIIVQADHGNGSIFGAYLFEHKRPSIEFLEAQYGIFSAIYLPPGIIIPEKITPVNLFRYIFNALFDDNLEVLPDRAFFTAIKEPYVFYDVTNDLKPLKEQRN